MTRKAARELAVRLAFALFENPGEPDELLAEVLDDEEYYNSLEAEDELFAVPPDSERDYVARLVRGVYAHGAELDGYIEKYSERWEFGRISRTAASVMRVAMYETLYMRDEVPPRAAMNEAVEITKKYETPETVSFVNGVLGAFARGELDGI